MTNPLAAPMPFEVIWYQAGARRRITTLSERQAWAICDEKREAGMDPSIYLGQLEVERVTPAENRRRLAELRAGEGPNSRIKSETIGSEDRRRRRREKRRG